MNPLSDLERLVAAIEHQGANIAPTYQEYMPIAFATANDCGEAGRTFFHRICRLSEKYVYEEADKLYDHALKAGNGRNGLGSVFHWAEIAGVKTDKQLADTFRQYLRENKNPSNLQAPLTPTHAHTYAREDLPPAFPDYPWPPFIKQMIDCGNSIAQRDILLLGVFTVLGGTLNKRVRVLYGQKYMYPCLQTFIVAPPASGKGALTWVRRLAEPIHEELMARYKDSLKNYREEKNRWDSLGKKRSETPEPEQPPLKMFLIAGDNSGTGILENLIEADGVGLICETEADTVSTAIGADHGHSSYVLGFLPTSEAVPVQTSPEQALFNALPMMFCRRQAVDVAAKNGIPEKTLDSSLKRMLEKGTLIKTARGEYAFSSHVCVRERRPKE